MLILEFHRNVQYKLNRGENIKLLTNNIINAGIKLKILNFRVSCN